MLKIPVGTQAVEWKSRSLRTVLTVGVPYPYDPSRPTESRTVDKLTAKAQKITIKLPWEIMTMFSDVLATDDEEDEDDIEAHEASIQRLKVRFDHVLRTVPEILSLP